MDERTCCLCLEPMAPEDEEYTFAIDDELGIDRYVAHRACALERGLFADAQAGQPRRP